MRAGRPLHRLKVEFGSVTVTIIDSHLLQLTRALTVSSLSLTRPKSRLTFDHPHRSCDSNASDLTAPLHSGLDQDRHLARQPANAPLDTPTHTHTHVHAHTHSHTYTRRDNMSAVTSILGYAGLGFLTRCYALGLQKRNVFDNLGGHAMVMTAFGALGYYLHGLEGRQLALIAEKKEQILKNRERLSAQSSEDH
ncbi:hypothetical protein ACQY0O_000543 [Thecaphora frezii]